MRSFHDRRWILAALTGVAAAALALANQIGREALLPVAVYSGWLLLVLATSGLLGVRSIA